MNESVKNILSFANIDKTEDEIYKEFENFLNSDTEIKFINDKIQFNYKNMNKWQIYTNDANRYVIFIEELTDEDGKTMYSFMDDGLNEYYTTYIDWYKLVEGVEILQARDVFVSWLEEFRKTLDAEFETKKQIIEFTI